MGQSTVPVRFAHDKCQLPFQSPRLSSLDLAVLGQRGGDRLWGQRVGVAGLGVHLRATVGQWRRPLQGGAPALVLA